MKWNTVNANFNDVNSGVSNAISGYSNVGNIFGQLRKSILDEEQRAWERAHKEKEFAENQYQFDTKMDFDWTKHDDDMEHKWATFEEGQWQFDKNYEQKDRHHADDVSLRRQDLAQRAAHNAASLALSRERLAVEKENNALNRQMLEQKLQFAKNAEERAAIEHQEKQRLRTWEQRFHRLTTAVPSDATPEQRTAYQQSQMQEIGELTALRDNPNASPQEKFAADRLLKEIEYEKANPAKSAGEREGRRNLFMGSLGDAASLKAAAANESASTKRGADLAKDFKDTVNKAAYKAQERLGQLQVTKEQRTQYNTAINYLNSHLPEGFKINQAEFVKTVEDLHGSDGIKNTWTPNASFGLEDPKFVELLRNNSNLIISKYGTSLTNAQEQELQGALNRIWFDTQQKAAANNARQAEMYDRRLAAMYGYDDYAPTKNKKDKDYKPYNKLAPNH